MAYVLEPISNVATPRGPSSSSKELFPSVSTSFSNMAVGLVISTDVTLSAVLAVTIAPRYVLFDEIVNVAIPYAPTSSSNPFTLSVSESFATMAVGTPMSITCRPLSLPPATIA